MTLHRVGIVGLGKYLPPKVLTNQDLEKIVNTTDEWITTRTGIKERRIISDGMLTSDLGKLASEEALKEAGLRPEEVELLIVASITPDMPFPATSCIVQNKLGAKNAAAFDVAAACSGFVHALTVAKQFIASGTYKNALVVGAEALSTVVDWKDRNTCVLFGDGAGACVLAPVKEGGILTTYLGSDGQYSDLLMMPGGGARYPTSLKTIEQGLHCLKMNGSEVFKQAVRLMSESVEKVLADCCLSIDDVDCLIPHQANMRILQAMCERLHVPLEKVYLNLDRYGNMSSASTATALCEAVREGRVQKGDIMVLVAFGSGFAWGACVVQW